MMNYIYNNLKGVAKVFCVASILVSMFSCGSATDEELISASVDAERMNITPSGFSFVLSNDTIGNKPDSMIVMIDRAVNSWRTAYIQGFEPVDTNKVYNGTGYYIHEFDTAFIAGRYNFLGFTYDTKSFDYSVIKRYIERQCDTSMYKLPIRYNVDYDGCVKNPKRLYAASLKNFHVYEPHNAKVIGVDELGNKVTSPVYIQMLPQCLTQRYEWSFDIVKTTDNYRIVEINVEVQGVPVTTDIYSGDLNAEEICKIKTSGTLEHADGFVKGENTVKVVVDASTVLAPSSENKVFTSDVFGNMDIEIVAINKKNQNVFFKVRHPMFELDDAEMYSLKDDMRTVETNKGARFATNLSYSDDPDYRQYILLGNEGVSTGFSAFRVMK